MHLAKGAPPCPWSLKSIQPGGTQATRGEPPSAILVPGVRAVLLLWLGSGRVTWLNGAVWERQGFQDIISYRKPSYKFFTQNKSTKCSRT